MKIAIVTNKVCSTGGVQIFTRDISNILLSKKHEVDMIGEECLKVKPQKDLEKTIGEYFNQRNKREKYDVVLCNGEFGYAVKHPRAINIFHGNYYGYAMSVKDLVGPDVTEARLQKANMQKVSAEGKYVVTVSNFAVQGLKDSGIKVDKVINNSIDTSVFYPKKMDVSDSAIALARGMWYEKGFDILNELADKGIKIKLFSDIKIDSLNVQNHDFIENRKLNVEYNKAAVLLFPSRFEGGSLTTLEAMACGCPILTTAVGYGADIKKIIPQFVADSNNIEEFLAKYVLIISNREKYSKEALDYFLEYHNPEKFKSEWISLIEGI